MLNCLKLIMLHLPLIAISTSFSVSSYAAGSDLIQRFECEACHGKDGVSQSTDIPTIAGIAEFNLIDQMLSYQEGRPADKVHHVSGDTSKQGDMATIANALTEQEIEQLAAHYSGLPFVRTQQAFDAELAARGKVIHAENCESCHIQGGSDPMEEASVLAGQQKGYLIKTLQQFYNGQRYVDKKMDQAIKNLSQADLLSLAEYYASMQ